MSSEKRIVCCSQHCSCVTGHCGHCTAPPELTPELGADLSLLWPITESTRRSPRSGRSTLVRWAENLWYNEPDSLFPFRDCSYFSCCWRKMAFFRSSWMLVRWGTAASIDLTVLKQFWVSNMLQQWCNNKLTPIHTRHRRKPLATADWAASLHRGTQQSGAEPEDKVK